MPLSREEKDLRTDRWRELRYLDLWSVVHFLSGITIALYSKYVPLGMVAIFAIVFLLLVMYEMFEVIANIVEYPTNRVMDVVVGMASFTPTYFVMQKFSPSTHILLLGLSTTLLAIISIIGWTESHKAEELQKELRLELEAQKEKFKARRLRRKDRKLQKRLARKRHFWTRRK